MTASFQLPITNYQFTVNESHPSTALNDISPLRTENCKLKIELTTGGRSC